MKKVLLVSIMIFSVVILSGCFHEEKKEQGEQDLGQEVSSVDEQKEEVKSEFERAMDMIQSGKKVKCVYVVESGGQKTRMTVHTEGKKYKTEMTFNGKEMNSIFDGENVHTWTKGEKTGMKMDLECMKQFGEQATEESKDYTQMSGNVQDLFEGAFDISCGAVSDIDFSVPADVSFTDQCEMMKKQMEAIEKMQQGQMQ